jgi:hypothetical protein
MNENRTITLGILDDASMKVRTLWCSRNLENEGSVETSLTRAKTLTIQTKDEFEASTLFHQGIKSLKKALKSERESLTKPLNALKNAFIEHYKPPETMIDEADRLLSAGRLVYVQKQERLRLEEENRLQAQALEEQKKQAELQKLEAEMHAENGIKPEPVQHPAQFTPLPTLQKQVMPTGTHTQKRSKFRVTSLKDVPRDYLVLDETKLGRIAVAAKGENEAPFRIPGIEFYQEEILSTRSL